MALVKDRSINREIESFIFAAKEQKIQNKFNDIQDRQIAKRNQMQGIFACSGDS